MFAFYRYWSKIDQYFFRHCDMTWYVIFYNVWCYNYDNEHFLQMISILLKYFNGTNYPSVSLCFALFWRGEGSHFGPGKHCFLLNWQDIPQVFFLYMVINFSKLPFSLENCIQRSNDIQFLDCAILIFIEWHLIRLTFWLKWKTDIYFIGWNAVQ